MSEHRLPRDLPPVDREGFQVHEVDTGKSFPIREATNEQLAKHLQNANEMHQNLVKQVMIILGQATNAAKASACISYEIDRRKRAGGLVLPPGLNH